MTAQELLAIMLDFGFSGDPMAEPKGVVRVRLTRHDIVAYVSARSVSFHVEHRHFSAKVCSYALGHLKLDDDRVLMPRHVLTKKCLDVRWPDAGFSNPRRAGHGDG